MLRGSSSYLNSGSRSRNTSQSASQSSLVRGNATEKNELESYLSTFKDQKRTAKKGKINWEELLQDSGGDERGVGFEVEGGGLGESESAFLKPKSREATGNRSKVSVVSKAKSTTAAGIGDNKSSHHIALDSKIRTLDSSALIAGSGGSVSEIELSETSDGNLFTNVIMADEFLLSEDESQAVANGRNKLRVASKLDERSPFSQRQVVRYPSSAVDDASKSTIAGQMKENVFSVDPLKKTGVQGRLTTVEKETSLSDSESETSSLVLKLKNVHTLDDLELAADSLDSTKDSSLAPDMKRTDEKSVLTKLRPAIVSSETKSPRSNLAKPTSGFRFSAPGFDAMQAQSATGNTVKLANHKSNVAQSTPGRQEDGCTDTYTYNDDDFESESIAEEEEEVIEEELYEEGRHLASDDEEDSRTTSRKHLSEETGLQEVTSYGDFHSDGETHDRSPSPASEEEEPDSGGSVAAADSETYTKTSSCEQQASGSTKRETLTHKTTTPRTPGVQDAVVQTPLPAAWPTVGPHYAKEYLDPSPIVPHVVSADVLEAITSYSPSTIALNDMLRTQLLLTRQLIASSRQTLENLSANLNSNHHYTTLEDTKDFIARNKPRVLTAHEAKQLIRKEEI